MEYNLCKKSVASAGWLLDTVGEEPVDVDLTLPDYCPDIERILRCSLVPKVYMANVSDDRLNVEGSACVRVMFVDGGKGCPRSYEHSVPFSRSFPLKDSPDRYALYVDLKPEYVNCRGLSPRKLSLHGALSLYARVAAEKPIDYCAYEGGDDLLVRSEKEEISALSGLCSDVFGMREDVPMNGKPPVGSVIAYRVTAKVTELKAIRNKMMMNAEGRLELMYCSAAGEEVECVSYAFPISHIADCEGVEDGDVIDGRLEVMSCDLSHSDDALDGSSVLGLDMKLCFSAMCWRETEIELIGDAFSASVEVSPRVSPMSFCRRRRCLRFTDIAKECISAEGDAIGRVIDVHCERIQVGGAVSGGAPLLSSKADISMLYENAEGEIRHLSREIDFDYNPSVEDCDSIESANGRVESLSYRIVDEHTVELRAEIEYQITVCQSVSRQAVTAVGADDDAPARSPGSALILYYADAGEKVWDISKRFCSRPEDIISENDLEGDELKEDLMLLIPTA